MITILSDESAPLASKSDAPVRELSWDEMSMLVHGLDEFRAAKRRIGAAYTQAHNLRGVPVSTLDGMLADAMRLCIGSVPRTQSDILAIYAAYFERMVERESARPSSHALTLPSVGSLGISTPKL